MRVLKALSISFAGLGCLILSGCGGRGGSTQLPKWQQPELLYLQSGLYDRLYVEIDTVEGTKVDDRFLPALKEFLRTHCEKPGGIEFVQGDRIPLDGAMRSHPYLVALEHAAGPPPDARAKRTAYLYVLIYDSKQMHLDKPTNPHVSARYPCAIYVDMAWKRSHHKHITVRVARHEAGHILGLCKNASHSKDAHCTNDKCLMVPGKFSLSCWLFGTPPKQLSLCNDCLADLSSYKDPRTEQHNMSFRGPVLLRKEKGYFVASWPFLVLVLFRPIETSDWQEIMDEVRRITTWAKAETKESRGQEFGSLFGHWGEFKSPEAKLAAFEQVKKDPNPEIAHWAMGKLKLLRWQATTRPAAPDKDTSASLVRRGSPQAATSVVKSPRHSSSVSSPPKPKRAARR